MIVKIILYFLVAYGISFAFVESGGPFEIFTKIREYADTMGLN